MNSPSDWAALIAALVVGGLAIFQTMLAMGLPLGRAAFGGTQVILSARRRVLSSASALVFLAALYVILARLFGPLSKDSPLRVAIWIIVGIFALSALANAASRSRWERHLMAPVALVLTLACVTVALTS